MAASGAGELPAKRARVEMTEAPEKTGALSAAAGVSRGRETRDGGHVTDGGLKYISGFGNEHASEALPGALPKAQNSPQVCAYGLYSEQLSGTAFTAPRKSNQRVWLYRIRPSVCHGPMVEDKHDGICADFESEAVHPERMRWQPQALPASDAKVDFIQGLSAMAGAGSAKAKSGLAVYLYACAASMTPQKRSFYNSDGDMLVVPQTGDLRVTTETGRLHVKPREILILPRGMRFSIDVDGPSRGYVLEIHQGHLQLPDLGPIGANGLAQPRDFLTPVASFEDEDGEGVEWAVRVKFGGKMFRYTQGHSPYDVVAWHGNYVPYKYDLEAFVCMNSVTVDHPDPSIYTVLTCQSDTPGVAVADFVIFPPRWMAMHRSFRPPYYHRNCMTEYMGMIYGKYDAKVGFVPGGSSLHSCMSAHGPDAPTFAGASKAKLEPEWFSGGLAFMFETTYIMTLTKRALEAPEREMDYPKCWAAVPKLFNPAAPDVKVVDVKEAAKASSSSSSAGAATGGASGVVAVPLTKADAVPASSSSASAGMEASYPMEGN